MNPQQVARVGEMFVAAEIHRRGGYAVTFAGNMPGIDILASDAADTRRISIQVKTKSSGSWHARFPRDAAECGEDPVETSFWVFVDLGGKHPAYLGYYGARPETVRAGAGAVDRDRVGAGNGDPHRIGCGTSWEIGCGRWCQPRIQHR
jgi:hypothetical protein